MPLTDHQPTDAERAVTITARATIEHDHDTRPMDSDCYTESEIQAWKDDGWSYVGFTVDIILTDADGWAKDVRASLWGIEWDFNRHVAPVNDDHYTAADEGAYHATLWDDLWREAAAECGLDPDTVASVRAAAGEPTFR